MPSERDQLIMMSNLNLEDSPIRKAIAVGISYAMGITPKDQVYEIAERLEDFQKNGS